MRFVTLAVVPLVSLACCGDDGSPPIVDAAVDATAIDATAIDATGIDASPVNPGFPMPGAVTKANMMSGGVWTEIGDANWSCLDTPASDNPSTQAIALVGTVRDLQDANAVGAAVITAFPGSMVTDNSGMAISSDVAGSRGDYSIVLDMLPAGQYRFGFKVEATGYLKNYLLNEYFDPATATQARNLSVVSESFAAAMPAFIGVSVDPSDGLVIATFRDCAGRAVSNAVATVSSTSGTVTHLPGAATYYFSAAASSLPVRHSQAPIMSKDGMFMVLGLPPQTAPAYIQIWGFPTATALADGTMMLLAELASPIEPNVVITGTLEAKRD